MLTCVNSSPTNCVICHHAQSHVGGSKLGVTCFSLFIYQTVIVLTNMVSSKLGSFPVTELTVWVVFQLTTFNFWCMYYFCSLHMLFFPELDMLPVCHPPCENGECVSHGLCNCNRGWTGSTCSSGMRQQGGVA